MADEILLKYSVDTSGLDKVADKVQDVTKLISQQQQLIKATYSDASLTGATKSMGDLQNAVSKVSDGMKDTSKQLQNLPGGTQTFNTLVQGAKGATTALDVLANSAKSFKNESLSLDKVISQLKDSFVKTFSNDIGTLFNAIAASQVQTIEQSFAAQSRALDKWNIHALDAAGNNAQKRAAVEERYAEQQQKLQREQAIKEAEIKRKQAIMDKAIKTVQVITQTAENITKYTGGLPATAPLLAEAIVTGALQLAAVEAQPIPQIPKFEKGGQVLAGGRIRNGHLLGNRHRQGGILINAEGGEYIWDIPTVQRHGDLIKAAHENRVEHLMLHKYIGPLLQNKTATAQHANEAYDDFMLRSEMKKNTRATREGAKYIADRVSAAITGSNYLNSRYHA